MRLKLLMTILAGLIAWPTFAQEKVQQDNSAVTPEPSLETDEYQSLPKALKRGWDLIWSGGYQQFQEPNNLYYLGTGSALSWWSFEEDKRLSAYYRAKDLPKFIDNVGDAGVFFNFPFTMVGIWYAGKSTNNPKLQQFMIEYGAALYLVLAESAVLSYVQIHERPSTVELSKWETDFRGKSSWPSGHMAPYSVLFFKTLQFYGPWYSLVPLAFTYMSAYQRMQDAKHWPSDMVGTFFISAFASEGVRRAAGYKHNHPFYKWAFEHEAQLLVTRHHGALGPKIIWTY
jgi:hypothetical protein